MLWEVILREVWCTLLLGRFSFFEVKGEDGWYFVGKIEGCGRNLWV